MDHFTCMQILLNDVCILHGDARHWSTLTFLLNRSFSTWSLSSEFSEISVLSLVTLVLGIGFNLRSPENETICLLCWSWDDMPCSPVWKWTYLIVTTDQISQCTFSWMILIISLMSFIVFYHDDYSLLCLTTSKLYLSPDSFCYVLA